MALSTTPVSICNTALLMIGADEITSFDDATREAKICNQLYQVTKENILQKYPWRYSLTTRQLAQVTSPPAEIDEFGYQYAYLVPGESLRIIRIDDPTEDYIIVSDQIWSNNTEIRIEYQIDAPEGTMPAYFVRALELEMAALLALSLTDDPGKHTIFQRKADLELARAKNIDAQEQPVLGPDDGNFLFTAVRV